MECRSDESSRSDYDYKYEEDPENMVVKKYKRVKGGDGGVYGGIGSGVNSTIKDPFIYQEEVVYSTIEGRGG
jgi:hypothetical protein